MVQNISNLFSREMLEYNYKIYGSMQKMSDALNVSVDSIYKYMKLYQINYSKHYTGIYSFNEKIFQSDSEESFYLAGFIAADGAIQNRKYSKILKISISLKDIDHLEKIKKLFDSNNPIKIYTSKEGYKCCQISLVSKTVCNDLEKFNVINNKTFLYTFPKFILNHPLSNHFMRGYLDGDGCLRLIKLQKDRTIQQAHFSVRGTYEFLHNYNAILERECDININTNRVKTYDSTFVINFNGNRQVKNIVEFLYKNASIYLDRKHDKIKHLLIKKHYYEMKNFQRRPENFFWITNISKRVVSLGDLALHIQPMTSMNLLDKRHHYYTEEQLIKSATSGSLFAKSDKVVVRQVPPGVKKKDVIPFQEDAIFPTHQRSSVEVENIKYEELNLSDDDFAKDNADTAEQDHLGKWTDKK